MAETPAQKRDRQYNEAKDAKAAQPKEKPAPIPEKPSPTMLADTTPPQDKLTGGYGGAGDRYRKNLTDEMTNEDSLRGYTREAM